MPIGGLCQARRYRGTINSKDITYETNAPPRTYMLTVGRPPRTFLPVSLDIRGSQRDGNSFVTENVFVAFNPSGSVQLGTRRYSSSGELTVNERDLLQLGDSALLVAAAIKILEICDNAR